MKSFLLCLCSIYLFSLVQAIKKSLDKTTNDVFGSILLRNFGLAREGKVIIDYEIKYFNGGSVSYTDSDRDFYLIALILTEKQYDSYYGELDEDDASIKKNINNLCNSPSLRRYQLNKAQDTIEFTIDYTMEADLYSLAIIQCRSNTNTAKSISFKIDAQMKNIKIYTDDSRGYSHLPIEFVNLVRLFSGEIIIYGFLLFGCMAQIYFAKSYAQNIHYVFLGTVTSAFIWLILRYNDYDHYNSHGLRDNGLMIAANIWEAITDTAVLTSLFLISLGWTLLRPSLSQKEQRLLVVSITIFFIFDVASAVCTDTSNQSCQALALMSLVLRSLILLAIIIAMNFTVTQLRAMLAHSPWVPSTPIQYARCKQFQSFRIVFLLFLLLPTAFLLVQASMYTWRESWLSIALNDMLTVLFFFHIGATFSPLYEPLLMRSFDGTMGSNNINDNNNNNQTLQNNHLRQE